jgi:FixJ family two-component response regulator
MIMNPVIATEQPTVLVIDDDPAVRGSLQFCLEVRGYRVRTYSCAADILNDSNIPVCGCLVIDYRLPDINGIDLLAALRQRNVMLPAILVTTHPSASVRARAEATGVQIVEKPLLNEALFEKISDAMRS